MKEREQTPRRSGAPTRLLVTSVQQRLVVAAILSALVWVGFFWATS